MQKRTVVTALIGIILFLIGVAALPDQPGEERLVTVEKREMQSVEPQVEKPLARRQIEERILAATVRIEIEAWIQKPVQAGSEILYAYEHAYGDGHGTIIGGRYLITHNHFGVRPVEIPGGEKFGFSSISLFRANGELLLADLAPAQYAAVVVQTETLILDFGTGTDGQGFFTGLGIGSVPMAGWDIRRLRPGLEVAQVDWDGRVAYVKWVRIETVTAESGPPRLVLSEGLTPGASGGGVFLNGLHIANNWQLVETLSGSGDVLQQVSTAALNSVVVDSSLQPAAVDWSQ